MVYSNIYKILGEKVRIGFKEGYVEHISYHGQPSGWTKIWVVHFEDGKTATVTNLSDIQVYHNGEWLSWRKFLNKSKKGEI